MNELKKYLISPAQPDNMLFTLLHKIALCTPAVRTWHTIYTVTMISKLIENYIIMPAQTDNKTYVQNQTL